MSAQAESLTEKQISQVYDHFENGAYKPRTVDVKASYRETLGRYYDEDKDAVRAYTL